MLTKWLAFHLQAARMGLSSLSRKPLATLMTVMVIAITLTLPALFWVFTDNVGQLTRNWQSGGNISLYLKPSLPAAEEASLLARVRATAGVLQATLKSPAEGLAELQQQEGMQDIIQYLPENPLPAMIIVIPEQAWNTPQKLEQLYTTLKAYPQVFQVKYDLEWVGRFHAVLQFVTTLAHGFMLLLGVAVVFIVGNTLRVAIQNHYEEIQVLKLIGASDAFIVRPFLYTGFWYGLLGAMLAVLLVHMLMMSLTPATNQLGAIYHTHVSLLRLSIRQDMWLIFVAAFLGWLGARITAKRLVLLLSPIVDV